MVGWKLCTYLIPGGQVLILMAWIPFFPIQEEEINHLFLILPAEGERDHAPGHVSSKRYILGGMYPSPGKLGARPFWGFWRLASYCKLN